MAGKRMHERDPLKNLLDFGKNIFDGVCNELVEKNVVNGDELQRIVKNVSFIVNDSWSLFKNIVENSEMAGKIFAEHIGKSKKQLSLKFEDERDVEEKASSVQSSASSLKESGKEEDEEIEENTGASHSSVSMLAADPEMEDEPEAAEESVGTLMLCPPEDFMKLHREKAKEQMESELREFAALTEHMDSDSTFLVRRSHGMLHGIYGTMHSEESADVLPYDTIYQIFNNCNSPGLRDKPKVIIVQACRGVNHGEVWLRKASDSNVFDPEELPKKVEADGVELSHVEKDFIAFYSTTPPKRTHESDPLKNILVFVKNIFDGVCNELVEKNVVNGDELQRIVKNVPFIVNDAWSLFKNIVENSEMAGKIFTEHIGKSKKQLSLKFEDENDVEEKASSVQSSSSSLKESGKEEDEEIEENTGASQSSVSMLAADPEMEDEPEAAEESVGTLKLCPPEDFMKLRREKAKEIYPIKEKEGRTRKALIICNSEFKDLDFRQGSTNDTLGMKWLLEDLGYSVVMKKDLTAKQMESELREFAALPEHMDSDSTFLVLMSHGILHGIYGTMHSEESADVLPYDTIYQIFNNCNCPGLRDKPKVIIVQACRGVNRGEVWLRKASDSNDFDPEELPKKVEADAVELSHVEKDFIAFYSTTPHNLSYRDEEGSYFIIKLIACFQKYACSCPLLEIFQKVQLSFEKPSLHSQMPTIDRSSLTRHFYLFPGN